MLDNRDAARGQAYLGSLSDAILPSVHDDGLAGDERGVVAGQEEDGTRDISWLREALDGLLTPGLPLLLLCLSGRCGRVGQTGEDRVCGDAVVSDVVRQASHEANDRHLRGDIMAHAWDRQANHVR